MVKDYFFCHTGIPWQLVALALGGTVPCCAVLCHSVLCCAVLPSPAKMVRMVLVLTKASSTLSLFIKFILQQQTAIGADTSHN
jgi:hypothetical protein